MTAELTTPPNRVPQSRSRRRSIDQRECLVFHIPSAAARLSESQTVNVYSIVTFADDKRPWPETGFHLNRTNIRHLHRSFRREESLGERTSTRAISRTVKSYSRRVALSARMNFDDSAFIGRSREKPSGLNPHLCDSLLLY
jgi:hypothetical protein